MIGAIVVPRGATRDVELVVALLRSSNFKGAVCCLPETGSAQRIKNEIVSSDVRHTLAIAWRDHDKIAWSYAGSWSCVDFDQCLSRQHQIAFDGPLNRVPCCAHAGQ